MHNTFELEDGEQIILRKHKHWYEYTWPLFIGVFNFVVGLVAIEILLKAAPAGIASGEKTNAVFTGSNTEIAAGIMVAACCLYGIFKCCTQSGSPQEKLQNKRAVKNRLKKANPKPGKNSAFHPGG